MTRNQRDWLNIAAFFVAAGLLFLVCYLALYPESYQGRMNACVDRNSEDYCIEVVEP